MLLVSSNAATAVAHRILNPAKKRLCTICNAVELTELGEIQGYRARKKFIVLECGSCKTSVVDPCVSDDRLYDAIYKNVALVPGYSRYHTLAGELLRTSNPLKRIANSEDSYYAVVKTLKERVQDKSRTKICEVGCGQGYLTYSLVKSGFDCSGVDISATAVELARKRYGNYYFCGTISEFSKRYTKPDIVIATELIEHLINPVQFVRNMLDTINERGIVVLTTPRKPFHTQRIWDTELPPVHLWWFGEIGLKSIAKQAESSVSFIDCAGFYKSNPDYYLNNSSSCDARKPVFDDRYEMINQTLPREPSRKFGKPLKRVLPTWMVQRLQKLRAGYSYAGPITGANSRSIAAIFWKPES